MTSTFLHLSQREGMGGRFPLCFFLVVLFALGAGTALAQTHSISGNVFLDHNGDGIRNGLDFGHPIIRVNVYDDANGNGSIDGTDPTLAFDATNSFGDYSVSFTAGTNNYLVQIELDDILVTSTLTTNTVVLSPGTYTDIDVSFRGEPVVCYSVSDRPTGGANSEADLTIFMNRVSGISDVLGASGTINTEAVAFNIGATTLFAANADRLGRINPVTGAFLPYPDPFGTGDGALGATAFSDVDGLSFDPLNSTFYGVTRLVSEYDRMFQIDTVTGLFVPDAFGPGVDYVEVRDAASTLLTQLDDIAVNPVDGKMYGVFNLSGTSNTQLAEINKFTGEATFISDVFLNGLPLKDVEGFGFTNFGLLTATTGADANDGTDDGFYAVDIGTGVATLIGDLTANGIDYEGSDCLTAKRNLISGCVYQDDDKDGQKDASEGGLFDVDVNIWVDINLNGIIDAGDELATTVTTDPNGEYTFTTGSNVQFLVAVVQSSLPDMYDLTTPGTDIVDLSNAVGGIDVPGIKFGAVRVPDFAHPCDPVDNVEVMVMGTGTDSYPATITVADLSDVDSIILEAIHIGGTAPNNVTFTADGQTVSPLAQEIETGAGGATSFRYYRATVNPATNLALQAPASGIFESFVAYVFKSSTGSNTSASGQYADRYLFVDDYRATLPIPVTPLPRNVEVTIPFTGLSNTATVAEVTLTAGGISQTFTIANPNQGNSLNISTFTLENVPGGATDIIVEINSPTVNGDAFVVGAIIAQSGCACAVSVIETDPANGEICLDETIDFSAIDQGSGSTYTWSFGSGATPATANGIGPHTVSYSTTGSKSVSMTVEKAGCANNTSTIDINVLDVPIAEISESPAELCEGSEGTFTATNAGAGATYAWNFGAGATPANATGPGPHQVSYNTIGAKSVNLLVTTLGCTATDNVIFTVDETPVSQIISTGTTICSYESVSLSVGNAVAGTTFSWDFGTDATPATAIGTGPHQVNYSSPGTKNIVLTSTLGNCASTDELDLEVIECNRPPDAEDDNATTFVNTPVSGDVSSNDTDLDGDNLIYNTTPIVAPVNGTVIINADGTYTYTPNNGFEGSDSWTYEVCDDGIPSICAQAVVSITVGTCPTVAEINGDDVACDADFATFTATDAGAGATYSWNFGVGATPATTTGIGPHDVSYSTNGTKVITLVVNNQCENTTTKTITRFSKPVAEITGATSTCANEAELYLADNINTISTATYAWNFGADATPQTSTALDPLVSWSTTGSKLITLTVTKNGCVETTTLPVTVTVEVFGDAGDDVTICEGGFVQIGGKPSGPPGANYFWDPPIGLNDRNVENPIASPNDTIEYTLFVTFNGCVTTAEVTVNVDVNSVPAAYAGGDTFTCSGQSVTLGGDTANPTGPSGASYSWSPANGLDDPFSPNPEATPVVTTTYTVTVEKNGCFKTDDIIVEVLPSTPADAGDDKRICIGDSQGALIGGPGNNPFASFQWTPTTGLSNPNESNTFANPTETTIYQLCSTRFGCTACDEVVVVVEDCNEPPIAINDDNITLINTPTNGTVLTNDYDRNGDNLTVTTTLVTPPANGTVTINPNGEYVYTPNQDFTGTDIFEYQVCDDGLPDSECATALVVIEVRANAIGNDPPVALDDAAITDANTPVSSSLLSNDGDPDGDNIIVNTTPVALPMNGTVSIDNAGNFVYVPDPGFTGVDNFIYQICDDGIPFLCDNATVMIIVNPNADENDPPVASDDAATTPINTPVSGDLLENDSDPNGDGIGINTTPTGSPNNGAVVINPDGTYDYTPNNGFEGTDTFSYQICDEGIPQLCDEAIVTIVVYPLNNVPPVATNDYASTTRNLSVDLDLTGNDKDPDSDPLIVTLTPITAPSAGTVFINPDGTARYVPNLDFVGTDLFEYEICDGISGCDVASVIISIYTDDPTENDPPIANDDSNSTPEGTPVDGNVITNDRDPDNDPLSINPTPVLVPNNGAVTINSNGIYTYTPNPGFVGDDQFTYELCDTKNQCDNAVVTITVFPSPGANLPPVAQDDYNTTPESTPVGGDLLANDADPEGDLITVNTTPLTNPSDGSVVINASGTYLYVPRIGFTGTDQFTYEICDDEGNCDPATVTIVVYPGPTPPNPPNLPPFADDDGNETFEDVPVDGDLSSNDADPEGTDLVYTTTTIIAPSHGTVAINNDGTYTYTPNLGYVGPDQFVYEVCDSGAPKECVKATAYLMVFPFNNPPVGVNDDNVTFINTAVNGQVLTNDFDLDGDNITINPVAIVPPSNGTATINLDGTYTYLPNTGFLGVDQFVYQICDSGVPGPLCTNAVVTITVVPEPFGPSNPPVAVDDDNITYVNVPIGGTVLPNDYDPEGGVLTIKTIPVVDPSAGLVVLNQDGSYVYTPAVGFVGQDQFDYEVCDDETPVQCAVATVYIDVLPLTEDNYPPFASDDFNVTEQATAVTGNMIRNDGDPDNDPLIVTLTPISNPSNGSVTLLANGTYTYTPNGGFFGTDQFVYEICDGISGCSKATVYILVAGERCVDLEVAVWLEGPMDTTTFSFMTTFLNLKAGSIMHRGLLPGQTPLNVIGVTPTPAGQPYSASPWNYQGTEGLTWGDAEYDLLEAEYGADVTDWVLIHLRSDIYETTNFLLVAGLVLEDGRVVFVEDCQLSVANTPAEFYVVIEHRNHMAVMTPTKISLDGNRVVWDFRNQNSYTGAAGFGSKEVRPGVWAMYAGDGDQNDYPSYDIEGTDKILWTIENGNFDQYRQSDFNLNGDVNGADKIIWSFNNGISSRVRKD